MSPLDDLRSQGYLLVNTANESPHLDTTLAAAGTRLRSAIGRDQMRAVLIPKPPPAC